MSEVVITFRALLQGRSATIQATDGHYDVTLPERLPYQYREYARLLRWKAVGFHNPGDTLLIEMGRSLADLLFPIGQADRWGSLKLPYMRLVRLRFSSDMDEYQQLPWELLYVGDSFLLQVPGSHLVREYEIASLPEVKTTLRILHITFGFDDELDLHRERLAVLAATMPHASQVHFCIEPSLDEIERLCQVFRPTVVHISGHGHFDDLTNTHYLTTSDREVPTVAVVERVKSLSVLLLLLWTCEGARFAATAPVPMDFSPNFEFVSFTYPVDTPAAANATTLIYEHLSRGSSVQTALGHLRGQPNEDEYAFFNITHVRRSIITFESASELLPATLEIPPLFGRDHALHQLNEATTMYQLTTLVAPRASGGAALLRHFQLLHSRTPLVRVVSVTDREHLDALWGLEEQVVIVTADRGLALYARNRSRVVYHCTVAEHDPIPDERRIILGDLYPTAAIQLMNQRALGEDDRNAVIATGLAGMPGILTAVARRELTTTELVTAFRRWNAIDDRIATLSPGGTSFAAFLFGIGGIIGNEFLDNNPQLRTLIPGWNKLVLGRQECLHAKIAITHHGVIGLAPDIVPIADTLFPEWVQLSRPIMTALAVGLINTADDNVASAYDWTARLIMDWAAHSKHWTIGISVLIKTAGASLRAGRSAELAADIETFLPHTQGMERTILRGHQATILLHEGRIAEALSAHHDREAWIKTQEPEDDSFRNLIAALTNQVHCLLEIGRIIDANNKLQEAWDAFEKWQTPDPDTETRLLAQRGEILSRMEKSEEAVKVFREAVSKSNTLPPDVAATFRHALAQQLWYDHQDTEAQRELATIERTVHLKNFPELHSCVLDLKARMLMHAHDPSSIEFALESYEIDRLRGDLPGILQSLGFLADVYIDQKRYELAEGRLDEAASLAVAHRLPGHLGSTMVRYAYVLAARQLPQFAREELLRAFQLGRKLGDMTLMRKAHHAARELGLLDLI